MSTIDEEKTEDCTVVMYIPFEIWEYLLALVQTAEIVDEFYDNPVWDKKLKELTDWLKECVQNYDGTPVEFYSNRKAVISNKTGNTIYLT